MCLAGRYHGTSMVGDGWSVWVVGLGAVPGILPFFLMLFPTRDSTMAHVSRLDSAARAVRTKVYVSGSDAIVDEVLRGIEIGMVEEEAAS